MKSFNVLRHFLDRPVDPLAEKLGIPFHGCARWYGGDAPHAAVLLVKEAPDPVEKTGGAVHPLIVPIQVFLRRRSEEAEYSCRVRPILLDQVFGIDHVLLRFGHLFQSSDRNLLTALQAVKMLSPALNFAGEEIPVFRTLVDLLADHALGQEIRKRLFNADQPHVFQNPCEEARIEKMKDRVLDSADVLVHGHPVVDTLPVQRPFVEIGTGKPVEVPRRLHKGVHRIRFPMRRTAALRAARFDKLLQSLQGRFPCARHLHVGWENDREVLLRDRHGPALVAIEDRNRCSPVTLPGNPPVFQPVGHPLSADSLLASSLAIASLAAGLFIPLNRPELTSIPSPSYASFIVSVFRSLSSG